MSLLLQHCLIQEFYFPSIVPPASALPDTKVLLSLHCPSCFSIVWYRSIAWYRSSTFLPLSLVLQHFLIQEFYFPPIIPPASALPDICSTFPPLSSLLQHCLIQEHCLIWEFYFPSIVPAASALPDTKVLFSLHCPSCINFDICSTFPPASELTDTGVLLSLHCPSYSSIAWYKSSTFPPLSLVLQDCLMIQEFYFSSIVPRASGLPDDTRVLLFFHCPLCFRIAWWYRSSTFPPLSLLLQYCLIQEFYFPSIVPPASVSWYKSSIFPPL